jgi:hypothetical protein
VSIHSIDIILKRKDYDKFSLSTSQLGVVMGYKLYTANFKGRIGLESGLILIYF